MIVDILCLVLRGNLGHVSEVNIESNANSETDLFSTNTLISNSFPQAMVG